jgi:hypothetical protein
LPGYAAGALAPHPADIANPFTRNAFAAKIGELIDATPPGGRPSFGTPSRPVGNFRYSEIISNLQESSLCA